jgi:hypothetical protein
LQLLSEKGNNKQERGQQHCQFKGSSTSSRAVVFGMVGSSKREERKASRGKSGRRFSSIRWFGVSNLNPEEK